MQGYWSSAVSYLVDPRCFPLGFSLAGGTVQILGGGGSALYPQLTRA